MLRIHMAGGVRAGGGRPPRLLDYEKTQMTDPEPLKPNVIFLMVEQMGQKWLEAAMGGICDLPNLSRTTKGM